MIYEATKSFTLFIAAIGFTTAPVMEASLAEAEQGLG